MRATYLVPLALVAFVAAVAGCSGGGSTSGSPVAPVLGPGAPAPAGDATFPLSIAVPHALLPGSNARSPQYVSPGTRAVAVYDGATVIYVGNFNAGTFTTVFDKTGSTTVTAGTCTTAAGTSTCTFTITTTIGAHTFDVITYPQSQGATSNARLPADTGTIPVFAGMILSEGQLAVTLNPGANPGQTMTLLGVADSATFSPPNFTLHLNGTGPLVGIIGSSYTLTYIIDDSSGNQIIQPGNYDNGPVVVAPLASPGPTISMTPISLSVPPAALGAQSINFTCNGNGTTTLAARAQNKPNATYASGLTYSAQNYSNGTLGQTTVQCVPNSATLPITVDSVKRNR